MLTDEDLFEQYDQSAENMSKKLDEKENVLYNECMQFDDIVTPIKVEELAYLLSETNFDHNKTVKVINGFTEGFDISFRGKPNRLNKSNNLPLHVGSKTNLWNKVMKEVGLQRVAGPFSEELIPYSSFIQSPIGLVLKSGGKTRLIFHLSYKFNDSEPSVKACTPKDICAVKYNNLDHMIQTSITLLNQLGFSTPLSYGKADLVSAFRILPIKLGHRKFLMFKAEHPDMGRMFYFIDKCLPFGSSISCAHFQLFSDALAHIVETKLQMRATNYLDDFLFVAPNQEQCNSMVNQFKNLCDQIGCLVSDEKTFYADEVMVFLGILLDGRNHVLSIPEDKRHKALTAINQVISKRKVMVKVIQKLGGLLNFIQRAVVPGKAFTHRIYDKLKLKDKKGNPLKQYHHILVDNNLKADCQVWATFLDTKDQLRFCRPFMDLHAFVYANMLNFYSDASLNPNFGFVMVFRDQWTYGRWGKDFILKNKPSIKYLELFALVAAVLMWGDDSDMINTRVIIFCDNEAVISMVNNMTSTCMHCMKLIRILTLNCLLYNRRIFVRHVPSKKNLLADSLSRMNLAKFWNHAPCSMAKYPTKIPDEIWPVEKVWFN